MNEPIQKPLGGHLVKGQVGKKNKLYDPFPVETSDVQAQNAPPAPRDEGDRAVVKKAAILEKKAWLKTEIVKIAVAQAGGMPELNYFQRPVNIGPTNVGAFSGNAVQPMKPGSTAVSASSGTAMKQPSSGVATSGTSQNAGMSKAAYLKSLIMGN